MNRNLNSEDILICKMAELILHSSLQLNLLTDAKLN